MNFTDNLFILACFLGALIVIGGLFTLILGVRHGRARQQTSYHMVDVKDNAG